jgi:2-polyprenyl-3-methyl-5-hydroxy-6-metoxy-1,4-benzoquinol methylase
MLGVMTTPGPAASDYDAYADQYAVNVAWRERGGPEGDPFGLLGPLLDLLGDVTGRRVLDAGCGEGYLARVLAARGARVTGIDLSPRLIELARAKDPATARGPDGATDRDGHIDYRIADLSQPVPGIAGCFDAVASYLVLNDVANYRGFAATLAASLGPGGRMALAFNNPYSAVIDRHVTDYFDTGATSPYRGLWAAGIKSHYHHRTLENYLDAFLTAGLRLAKLTDVPARADAHRPDAYLPEGGRFPRFMLLAFTKP